MQAAGSTLRRTRSTTSSASEPHISLDTYVRPTKRSRATPTKTEDDSLASKSRYAVKNDPDQEVKPPSKGGTKRPRAKGRDYSHLGADPLTDRIQEGLDVLFCGENPGIRTAETQLHCRSVPPPALGTSGLIARYVQMRRRPITSIKRFMQRA